MTPVSLSEALGLAFLAGIQVILLAGINLWAASRKEKRDAERAIAKAKVDAQLKQQEKNEDYKRQDQVASRVAAATAQVASAARLLADAQAETIRKTDEVAQVAAASDQRIQAQLTAIDEQGKKIHILVNSDMTAARTNERDQTRLTLLALKRVQSLSIQLGTPSSEDEEKAIGAAEKRILELDQILADRHAAQLAVEAEAKASGTPTVPTTAAAAKHGIEADQQKGT
jgi:hypothetical protein